MNANRAMTWTWVLGVALAAQAAAGDAPSVSREPGTTIESGSEGRLWLRPNPDFLDRHGLRLVGIHPKRIQAAYEVRVVDPLQVVLGDGAPTGLRSGSLEIDALTLADRSGATTPPLRLVPVASNSLDWTLVDAKGAVWFHVTEGMRSPDLMRDGVRLVTADLRVGPAFAAWRGIDAEQQLVGNFGLRLPLPAAAKVGVQPKSCAAPNWPGTPGYVTDVMLVDLNRVDVLRCRRVGGSPGVCDGPGGLEGEVVFVPSATLRNRLEADAADVPWYTKFTGDFAPYGNDQHPYLVWSMYRFDADGRIEQIARSGLKHAFATANELCIDATCPVNGHILGRGCQDLYNAGSNDFANALSSRAELVPATGIWGRCGSVYDDVVNATGDPGCDAVQDTGGAFDGYLHRMLLRETEIDAALNPGATYYVDAWYVVRDDVDIFNTMGYRTLQPEYTFGAWRPGTLGSFTVGPVIDRWVADAGALEARMSSPVVTDEGQARVASRVRRLPDGRYRYDYAIANFDFTRAVLDPTTTEPNIRIVSNRGLSALSVALPNGATVDASEFSDGDSDAANDWVGAEDSGRWRWVAPGGVTQDWGSLVFARIVSPQAPSHGAVRIDIAESGSPAFLEAVAWVPDGSNVFRDSFE
jgi:hypothetical protein